MAKIFLLISKNRREFTHLDVKCAVSEITDGFILSEREFTGPAELEEALWAIGIPESEAAAAHQVAGSGLPTFITITLEMAKKLGVLEQKDGKIPG